MTGIGIFYYRLADDRRTVVPCTLLEYADTPHDKRKLKETLLPDGRRVLTMFHGFCDNLCGAYLCGTAIMGKTIDEIGQYNNVPAALAGHDKIVEIIVNGGDPYDHAVTEDAMPEDVGR